MFKYLLKESLIEEPKWPKPRCYWSKTGYQYSTSPHRGCHVFCYFEIF